MTFQNAFAGKRVFITGHTGFKGSWLAAWLHVLGADVTGFAQPPEYAFSHFEQLGLANRIRHIEGDIRDASSLRRALCGARPEFVFHLAAQPLVRRSYAEPKLTFDTNVGGSVNLLEAVRDCDAVRALIYVTSDKCYRNRESREGYRETDELGGHDPYSASKACAELVLASYRSSFFSAPGASIMAASVRAGNTIGGGDFAEDRIVPDCIRALAAGRPIPVRNPHAIRPWQHVLEPLSGYLALASRLYTGEDLRGAWNFGPERESHRTVGELVNTVIESWGSGSKELVFGGGLGETSTLYLNCDKSERELGWRPVFGFRQAVRRTVDWYREAAAGAGVWELTTAQIDEYSAAQPTKKRADYKSAAG